MNILSCLPLYVTLALANFLNPSGWLDRLVQFHKQKFIENVRLEAPITIKASIISSPPGYVDSPEWDFGSVMRLITLMRKSQQAKPAVKALRRMLGPTRRFMSIASSYKYFPSLFADAENDIYYDMASYETDIEDQSNSTGVVTDDAIIMVSNPVESRLPSGTISVALLKEILERRAEAAREMPSTKKRWTWKTKPKTAATTVATSNSTADDANTTTVSGGADDPAANGTGSPTEGDGSPTEGDGTPTGEGGSTAEDAGSPTEEAGTTAEGA